jgi:hypothetical protein
MGAAPGSAPTTPSIEIDAQLLISDIDAALRLLESVQIFDSEEDGKRLIADSIEAYETVRYLMSILKFRPNDEARIRDRLMVLRSQLPERSSWHFPQR